MIHDDGNKIWMDISSTLTDSEEYGPFDSNYSKNCFKNSTLCIAKRMCTITEKLQHQEIAVGRIKNFVNLTQYIQKKLFKKIKGYQESVNNFGSSTF